MNSNILFVVLDLDVEMTFQFLGTSKELSLPVYG